LIELHGQTLRPEFLRAESPREKAAIVCDRLEVDEKCAGQRSFSENHCALVHVMALQ
jgi:hypothetical protein